MKHLIEHDTTYLWSRPANQTKYDYINRQTEYLGALSNRYNDCINYTETIKAINEDREYIDIEEEIICEALLKEIERAYEEYIDACNIEEIEPWCEIVDWYNEEIRSRKFFSPWAKTKQNAESLFESLKALEPPTLSQKEYKKSS